MARGYELYKELSKTKSQRLITDVVNKRTAVQSETENINLVGVVSYSVMTLPAIILTALNLLFMNF